MPFPRAVQRILCLSLLLALLVGVKGASGDGAPAEPAHVQKFPFPQLLTYRIEWHMVNAGTANLEYKKLSENNWQTSLNIESAGLVNRLYHVTDKYVVTSNEHFCPNSATLDAREGNRHTVTQLTFDQARHTVEYHEHDAVKNTDKEMKLSTGECTREVSGALAALSTTQLALGRAQMFSVTNGKRAVNARIESQAREPVMIEGKTYPAIRYEAFLFDNVLYKRRGRVFIWVTDDAERTPVQLRFEIGFPIGTILLQLEKQQKF